jgi:hypothetical protein
MAFRIFNRRGDLRTLSDLELAARLESAWEKYQSIVSNEKTIPRMTWRLFLRYPPLIGVIYGVSWALAAFLSLGEPLFSLTDNPLSNAYTALCEVRELTQELERRVKARKEAS